MDASEHGGKAKAQHSTPYQPIDSPAELWHSLCKEGGLSIAWRHGKAIPSYDRILESDISKSLFNDDSLPLATLLEQSEQITTAQLLNTFFACLQPFSQMMNDIYRMLDVANASRQDRIVRVSLKPEGLDQSLLVTLQQFREWAEEIRLASIQVLIPEWTANALWDLRRAFANEPETWDSPPAEAWDDEYRSKPGFVSPPEFELTGQTEFDSAATTAYGTIHWFIDACRTLAPGHTELANRFRAEGGYERASSAKYASNPEFRRLYNLAHAESDYWPVGIVTQIRKARLRILSLSDEDRHKESARLLNNVTELISSLPKIEVRHESLNRVLSDIFQLPVWKERSAVYSVWIATQIVAALEPRPIFFHSENGQLDFGFSGSRLATVQTDEGDFSIWSELRTELLRPASRYRKLAIQPDYRIVAPGDEKDPKLTRAVIECKQYKTPSIRNFSEAMNDYGVSCPHATITLVNYGQIGKGLSAHLEPEILGRSHFIEHFKPHSNISELKDIIDRVIPDNSPSRSRWSSPCTVRLSWTETTCDLDLHASVLLKSGTRVISYRNREDEIAAVTLSEDIRSGPGQEILQIRSWLGSIYIVAVNNYSEAPLPSKWAALVEVIIGEMKWEIPLSDDGTGRPWWYVCKINALEGTVHPICTQWSYADVAHWKSVWAAT